LQKPQVPPPVQLPSTVHTVPLLVPPVHCLVCSLQAKLTELSGSVNEQAQVASSGRPLPDTLALHTVLVDPESPWTQAPGVQSALAVHAMLAFAPDALLQTFCMLVLWSRRSVALRLVRPPLQSISPTPLLPALTHTAPMPLTTAGLSTTELCGMVNVRSPLTSSAPATRSSLASWQVPLPVQVPPPGQSLAWVAMAQVL